MDAFNKYVAVIAEMYISITINEIIISINENKIRHSNLLNIHLNIEFIRSYSYAGKHCMDSAIDINFSLAASMFPYQSIFPYHQTCFQIHAWGSIALVKHLWPE